jgi:hypothetical protein
MRAGIVTGLSLLVLAMASAGASAADSGRQPASRAAPVQPGILSEFRFGLSAQDPWGVEGNGGSANLTGEILLAKPFTPSDLFTSYFIPRPHIGGSVNFNGRTSFAYAGLTWTVDVTPSVFVEGSLGGAVTTARGTCTTPSRTVRRSAARPCSGNRDPWACASRPTGTCWPPSSISPTPAPKIGA